MIGTLIDLAVRVVSLVVSRVEDARKARKKETERRKAVRDAAKAKWRE